MTQTQIKLVIAAVLFLTWVALVVFNVPHADDLITAIKTALAGLGAHTLTMVVPGQSATPSATTGDSK
jgi:hypothetical protein